MKDQSLRSIQEQIGYNFKNLDLLQQAFVRRSYAKENGGEDNEVLEFIGDKVLDIVIVKILTETFGFYTSECEDYDEKVDFDEFCCEYSEGKLTELKSGLVEKKMLASRIDRLRLADYLIMGNGDQKNRVDEEDSVKEDLFEAIVGAVALDSGWDWEEIQSTVEYMLEPDVYLSGNHKENYVELIREWPHRRYDELPRIRTYRLSDCDRTNPLWYPNKAQSKSRINICSIIINAPTDRAPHFKCELILTNISKKFNGSGGSKNEARKDACKLAYGYLKEHGLLFSIQNEIKNPNRAEAINQLETLARRGYFSIPTYGFEQKHNRNGSPVWKCECHIKEYDTYFCSKSSSKKDAKKSAAYEMLKHVLEE